jgi:hypothetical protein
MMSISAALVSGRLDITGTDVAEYVTVQLNSSPGKMAVRSDTGHGDYKSDYFDTAKVKSIRIRMNGGNDTVALTGLSIDTDIDGGSGNDFIELGQTLNTTKAEKVAASGSRSGCAV